MPPELTEMCFEAAPSINVKNHMMLDKYTTNTPQIECITTTVNTWEYIYRFRKQVK